MLTQDTADALALAACAGSSIICLLLAVFHWVISPLTPQWSPSLTAVLMLTCVSGLPAAVAAFMGVVGEWALFVMAFGLPLVISTVSRTPQGGLRFVSARKCTVVVLPLVSMVSAAAVCLIVVLGPHSQLVHGDGAFFTPRGYSNVEVGRVDEPVVNYYPHISLVGGNSATATGLYLLGGDLTSVTSIHILPSIHEPALLIDVCNVTLFNITVECRSRPCIVSRVCNRGAIERSVAAFINGTQLALADETAWVDSDSPLSAEGKISLSELHARHKPLWHAVAERVPVVFTIMRDSLILARGSLRWFWAEVGSPLTTFIAISVWPLTRSALAEAIFTSQTALCGSLDGLSGLVLTGNVTDGGVLRDGCSFICGNVIRRLYSTSTTADYSPDVEEELTIVVSSMLHAINVGLFETLRDLLWVVTHTGIPWSMQFVRDSLADDYSLLLWNMGIIGTIAAVPLRATFWCLNFLFPSLVHIEGGSDNVGEWLANATSVGGHALVGATIASGGAIVDAARWMLASVWTVVVWSFSYSIASSGWALDATLYMLGGASSLLLWVAECGYTLMVWSIVVLFSTMGAAFSLYASCSLSTHLFVCVLQTSVVVVALLREIKGREENLAWYQYSFRLVNLYYQNLRPVLVYTVAHAAGVVLAVGTSFLPLSGTTGLHFLVVQVVLPVASTYGLVVFVRDESNAEQNPNTGVPLTLEERERAELAKWRLLRTKEIALRKKTASWFLIRAACTVALQKVVGDVVAVLVGELLMVGGIFAVVVCAVIFLRTRGHAVQS